MISRLRRHYKWERLRTQERVLAAVEAIDRGSKKFKGRREKVNFKESSELKVTAELKSNRARRTKSSVTR